MSADVFDFLQQRIMHQIKMPINAAQNTAPIEIPAITPPVRSRKEKNWDETVSFHARLLREYHVKK